MNTVCTLAKWPVATKAIISEISHLAYIITLCKLLAFLNENAVCQRHNLRHAVFELNTWNNFSFHTWLSNNLNTLTALRFYYEWFQDSCIRMTKTPNNKLYSQVPTVCLVPKTFFKFVLSEWKCYCKNTLLLLDPERRCHKALSTEDSQMA